MLFILFVFVSTVFLKVKDKDKKEIVFDDERCHSSVDILTVLVQEVLGPEDGKVEYGRSLVEGTEVEGPYPIDP